MRTLSGRSGRRTALAGLSAALVLLGSALALTPAHADGAVVSRRASPSSTTGATAAPSSTTGATAAPSSTTGCDPRTQQAAVDAVIARTGRADDQPGYTPRQMRRIETRLRRRLAARTRANPEARFRLALHIPVAVHVLAGPRDPGPSRVEVRRQIRVLNRAYDGGESAGNTATPFSFQMVSFDRTVNEAWHTASIFDAADRAARRALHAGGPDELNLYINSPAPEPNAAGVTLGWSSMPWWVRRPRLDGVTVNEDSLPGGRLLHFNRGDSAVHEIGHWLGLFHTFQGGCSRQGDRVDDTPPERVPAVGCPVGRDSCPAPGTDPVHNFMDYSTDPCMNRFTPGQVNRMTDNWLAYRTP